MKNRGVLVLVGAVVVLGGYLAWDMHSEKREGELKTERSLVFPYPVDQVNEIIVENPKGGQTRLVKTIDGWTLESPVKDAADSSFTDDYLAKIMKDGYTEVAKEGEGIDWKIYGLDNPIGKITVKTQTGMARTLEVSAKQNFEENGIARIAGESRVLIVPWSWSANAGRTALDFRDKRLFRHALGGIDRVEVTNSEGGFTVERKDGVWRVAGQPWELDQNRVRELLSMLNETRANDFITEGSPLKTQLGDYGLAKPKVRLKVGMNGRAWEAQLGDVPQKGEYASVSDPAFLLQLDSGSLPKFERLALDGLREKKKVFEFSKEAVKRIEFETPLKKAVFVKNGDTWSLFDGAEGVSAESGNVQGLVDQLREAAVTRYLSGKPAASFKAENRLRLMNENTPVFTLEWMSPHTEKIDGLDTKVVRAKAATSPEVFLLNAGAVDKLALHRLTKGKPAVKDPAPADPATPAETPPASPPAENKESP